MIDHGENAEFITVRLCFGLESIRLILAYGPQESDAKDEIENFYKNLRTQLDRRVLKGDSVLLFGDLNAKLGKTVINRDIHDMSANGKLLCDIIDKYNLCVVNALRLCKGVFTRVSNNKNSAEKSVLDYVIVSSNLPGNIVSMTIDEGKLFTPWRNLQRANRFTDHNAIISELQCERSKGNDRSNRKVVWNFNEKGLESFVSSLEMTHPFLRYRRVAILFRSVTKIGKVARLNRILGMCFKKKRINERKQLYNSEVRSLISKRKKLKDVVHVVKIKERKLSKLHGSQSRAFSRERSTQPPPRCQGSDRNKLHGARSLFNFLLLKI